MSLCRSFMGDSFSTAFERICRRCFFLRDLRLRSIPPTRDIPFSLICTYYLVSTYELQTMCWASNHQNNYRNVQRAHFPFNLPLFGDLCQHIKKQLRSANLRPNFSTFSICHIWITFATTWFVFAN
jgi:hypothetical protein